MPSLEDVLVLPGLHHHFRGPNHIGLVFGNRDAVKEVAIEDEAEFHSMLAVLYFFLNSQQTRIKTHIPHMYSGLALFPGTIFPRYVFLNTFIPFTRRPLAEVKATAALAREEAVLRGKAGRETAEVGSPETEVEREAEAKATEAVARAMEEAGSPEREAAKAVLWGEEDSEADAME